jgi:hypothetical protein
MARYAENTAVPSERSKAEIERTLARYGATAFAYGTDAKRAVVQFQAHDRYVRFILPMPDPNDPTYARTPTGRPRSAAQALVQYEQATRQRWRALALAIKAKLEAVETEITTFEQEFLAHIVLPDGSAFGDWAAPQIEEAYQSGTMPAGLLALPPAPVEDAEVVSD